MVHINALQKGLITIYYTSERFAIATYQLLSIETQLTLKTNGLPRRNDNINHSSRQKISMWKTNATLVQIFSTRAAYETAFKQQIILQMVRRNFSAFILITI